MLSISLVSGTDGVVTVGPSGRESRCPALTLLACALVEEQQAGRLIARLRLLPQIEVKIPLQRHETVTCKNFEATDSCHYRRFPACTNPAEAGVFNSKSE